MKADSPPPLPVDPNLAQEQEQAHNDLVHSLQNQAQEDTANLMARYGTRLAMSGAATSSPLAPTTSSTPAAGGGFVSSFANAIAPALANR